jgi:hypothetical protein
MPSSVGSADYVGTDSGNTSFIINCSALVLLMALPGIMVFYGAAAPVALFARVRLASPSICRESPVADRQEACAQNGTRATRSGCARANPRQRRSGPHRCEGCGRRRGQSEASLTSARAGLAPGTRRCLSQAVCASSRSASLRAKRVCVAPGRWAQWLQEIHVHLSSDLCHCQLDLHNLADVRLFACLWVELGWHKERVHWRRQLVLVLGRRQGYPLLSCLPACKIIICLPVCNISLSSELDRGRRAEACVCCIASF